MDGSLFLVIEKVMTLFIVLFVGIVARKTNIIDLPATKKLSAFLLNVTQPLMILTSFQMDFDSEKLKNGFSLFALSIAVHIFTSAAAFLFYRPIKDGDEKKVYEMATIFCNCSFLGYPVLKVVFGEDLGVFYGAFYAMFFNIFIWTYGVYLITRKGGKKFAIPAKKIFLNAGMISSVLGIAVFLAGIKLPRLIYDSSKLIGDMTFPLSMVIIGSLISDINPKDMFFSAKNYCYIAIKLIAMPLSVGLFCYALRFPPLIIYMGTIMSSMPSAANVAIFAQEYGANSKLAATNVGLSTLFSIGTIPLAIYFLENVLKL
ncbi:MAG: AEC family transporter [Oscillospiraceae bacterium]|nr:AEC family transporter [Oscillospiraceae bacterium]